MVTSLVPRRAGRELFSEFGRNPFRAVQAEIDDMISRFSGRDRNAIAEGTYVPSLDLSETDGEMQIKVDVPGIKPEEVDIEVSGNTIRVRGEHKEEKEEKGRTYHRVERSTGSFFRSIELPCEIKQDDVAANYKDGVLTISLPKCEANKPHKVTVKTNGK